MPGLGCATGVVKGLPWSVSEKKSFQALTKKIDITPECGLYHQPTNVPQSESCPGRMSEAQKRESSSLGVPEGLTPPPADQVGCAAPDVGTHFSHLLQSPPPQLCSRPTGLLTSPQNSLSQVFALVPSMPLPQISGRHETFSDPTLSKIIDQPPHLLFSHVIFSSLQSP